MRTLLLRPLAALAAVIIVLALGPAPAGADATVETTSSEKVWAGGSVGASNVIVDRSESSTAGNGSASAHIWVEHAGQGRFGQIDPSAVVVSEDGRTVTVGVDVDGCRVDVTFESVAPVEASDEIEVEVDGAGTVSSGESTNRSDGATLTGSICGAQGSGNGQINLTRRSGPSATLDAG